MFHASMNFALGEEIEALREMVHKFAQERGKKWVRLVCTGSPSKKNTAAQAWATSRIVWRSKKSAARRVGLGGSQLWRALKPVRQSDPA